MNRQLVVFVSFTILVLAITPVSLSMQKSQGNRTLQTEDNKTSIEYQTTGTNETKPYGGTLRIHGWTKPDSINPHLSVYHFPIPVFSELLRIDENGSIAPDLAFDWEVSTDSLNYTFYLYGNVTWHDGMPFNASDVEFTFETVINDPAVLRRDYISSYISSVEAVNSSVVILYTKNETGYFSLDKLAHLYIPILPKHLYYGTDLATNPYNDEPIGTGPFTFVDWNPEANLTLQANLLYFRGRPYLDSLLYRWDMAETEIRDYLLDNEIDITGTGLSSVIDPALIRELEQTAGISVISSDVFAYSSLGLNLRQHIFNDIKVRQAIAYAINTSMICESSYWGYARPATGPIPPESYWYNPNVTRYPYNRTKSEELLDDAGYFRDPHTNIRFNTTIKCLDITVTKNVTELIREYLYDVGINTTMSVYESYADYTNDLLVTHDFNLIITGIIAHGADPEIVSAFHSNIYLNAWNYSNARLDYLVERGELTSNMEEKKQIYDEAQEIIAEDIPNVFLTHYMRRTIFHNDFHGFVSNINVVPVDAYSLERVWYEPTLSGEGNCPYQVCFMDPEGRRTGYYNGTAYQQIPNSTYSGLDSDPQLVKIRNPLGVYNVSLFGVENDSFSFEFVNLALDYKNVQVVEGYIHENETVDYIVKAFEDGMMKVYSPEEYSAHDLGITSVVSAKTVLGEGSEYSIDVTVFNYGDYVEDFNVTLYANMTMIQREEVSLASGGSTFAFFKWNTTGFPKSNYTITIQVSPVLGEMAMMDNLIQHWVIVAMIGDITGSDGWPDGECNMMDVATVARHFGQDSPPAPANYDVVYDGAIDMVDVATVARHFGETDP